MPSRPVRLLDGSLIDTDDVLAIAARQHDVLLQEQLAALGYSDRAIGHRVRTGRLERRHRGVYATTRPNPLQLIAAAVLACAPAVASHRSAAHLWGLLRTQPPLPEVTVHRTRRPRHPTIVVHRAQTADRTTRHGIPVTSPARTLLDLAATEPSAVLARALQEAHVHGLVRRPELEAQVATGRPGAAALRRAIESGAHRTRSNPERELLALCERARILRPRINEDVAGHEVDALWPDHRLAVEIDTFATHGHPRAFRADHARQLALAAAGHELLRFTDEQLDHDQLALAAVLATTLARRAPR